MIYYIHIILISNLKFQINTVILLFFISCLKPVNSKLYNKKPFSYLIDWKILTKNFIFVSMIWSNTKLNCQIQRPSLYLYWIQISYPCGYKVNIQTLPPCPKSFVRTYEEIQRDVLTCEMLLIKKCYVEGAKMIINRVILNF